MLSEKFRCVVDIEGKWCVIFGGKSFSRNSNTTTHSGQKLGVRVRMSLCVHKAKANVCWTQTRMVLMVRTASSISATSNKATKKNNNNIGIDYSFMRRWSMRENVTSWTLCFIHIKLKYLFSLRFRISFSLCCSAVSLSNGSRIRIKKRC